MWLSFFSWVFGTASMLADGLYLFVFWIGLGGWAGAAEWRLNILVSFLKIFWNPADNIEY